MPHLSPSDLYSLEEYAQMRSDYRATIMAHKKNRALRIGPNATIYFEDQQTMQYQIQEMLRIEKIFEQDGIRDELEAYNPLIPDGDNWKATFMLEYDDVAERQTMLGKLIGIEKVTWMQIEGFDKVFPIANEDLTEGDIGRETEDKTSSVHFLRFQLDEAMVDAAKGGAPISAGIDHENYRHTVSPIAENIRSSLNDDLDDVLTDALACLHMARKPTVCSKMKRASMSYHFTKTIDLPFDRAIETVTKAWPTRDLAFSRTIDVSATLKKKIDVDYPPYVILGACNPGFAHKALLMENKIGTMLPCNVIVQQTPVMERSRSRPLIPPPACRPSTIPALVISPDRYAKC